MIKILCWSDYARDALAAGAAAVHSAYKRTINLRTDGGALVALQARGTPLSPLTVELDAGEAELAAWGAVQGLPLTRTAAEFFLGPVRLDSRNARVWDPALDAAPAWARADLPAAIDMLCACLRAMQPCGGFADLALPEGRLWRASPAARRAAALLAPGLRAARSGEWTAAAEAAAALIGRGEGLTPSGDDFLCGMLAGLGMLRGDEAAAAFAANLRRALVPRLGETNDISAAFLRCACQGLFSQAVLALAAGCGSDAVIRHFSAIGHSSGADTLNGILFALRCIGGALTSDWEDIT